MPGNYLKYNEFEYNQGPIIGAAGGIIRGSSTVSATQLTRIFIVAVKAGVSGKSTVAGRMGVRYAVVSSIKGTSKVKLNLYGKLESFGMTLNGLPVQLSNVNRSYKISYNIIGLSDRNANGRMVRRSINRKRKFSISWKWLPYSSVDVLDGGAGASTLQLLWQAKQLVILTVPDGVNGELQEYVCMFDQNGFKRTIEHNGSKEYWHVDISLIEV